MATAIHEYALKLVDTWEKSFGSKHVMSITGVKYKLKKVIKEYHNQVYDKAHRKTKKKKPEEEHIKSQLESKESMRKLNKKWRERNDTSFDIGKNMKALVGREKDFYVDQRTV